ncbi:hypothetical protein LSCM1_01184 [Leishmania martiniquensis]|uniref:Uncharacterized protein n=1 Tax=Leishmania martiniquensis TaxID=1580590 RepID=A0A836GXM0_9TRYP|nr:hypothetical protein LSCM1_01184 [Leishmania martiniquensis]
MLPLAKNEEALTAASASCAQAQSTETPKATCIASSSPTMTATVSPRAGSASDSGICAGATAPRKTRPLKDVEAEESRHIYETLYASLDGAADAAIRDELSVGDTVRFAHEAKGEFTRATAVPLGEKAKRCTELLHRLSGGNQQVAYVFIVFSVLMLTMPVAALLIGMQVIAPWLGADPTFCGGGLAVFAAMLVMGSYVVYAMMEDAERGRQSPGKGESKKAR